MCVEGFFFCLCVLRGEVFSLNVKEIFIKLKFFFVGRKVRFKMIDMILVIKNLYY